MKIVLTGGGSGGHFYPVIAVAEAINDLADEEKYVQAELFYLADSPYNKRLLFENHITYKFVPAGKLRRYFSLLNIFDLVKTFFGLLRSLWTMYLIFPDVVFSKGAYASVPVLFAARLFGIPVVIHESDTVPGRANTWAGKFATKIAVSWTEAAMHFPKDKTAVTGNPIRKALLKPLTEGAREFLNLDKEMPTILILGGSQGATLINDIVIDALPELLKRYQIIHQAGEKNFADAEGRAGVVLRNHPNVDRYKVFGYLDDTAMKMSAGAADFVVSRGGSGIFEIAQWGLPSIIVPITETHGDHQRTNAYTYARTGAAEVIEEKNFAAHILVSELDRLMADAALRKKMGGAARAFARPDAAKKIARALVGIALAHEA